LDCQVQYSPGDQPLEVELIHHIQGLSPEELRTVTLDCLSRLGIKHGVIKVEDFAARQDVIMARIETVIKQSHPSITAEVLPQFKENANYSTSRDRIRRTALYMPGNQPGLRLKPENPRPDGIILDLEDSVPLKEKDAARLLVRNSLRTVDYFGAERMVRINRGDMGLLDLEAVVPHNVHILLLPKAETAAQIIEMEERVDSIKKRHGLDRPIFYIPILESAKGILNAREISEASKNTVALAIGLEDYTADIGAIRTLEGSESTFARSMLVNTARALDLQPIDAVFSDVENEENLRRSVQESRRLGFAGMGCIHPRQVLPIHEEYAPSKHEIDHAQEIIRAAVDAEKQGLGVIALDSKMIDPPVVRRAERIIQKAIDIDLIDINWQEE